MIGVEYLRILQFGSIVYSESAANFENPTFLKNDSLEDHCSKILKVFRDNHDKKIMEIFETSEDEKTFMSEIENIFKDKSFSELSYDNTKNHNAKLELVIRDVTTMVIKITTSFFKTPIILKRGMEGNIHRFNEIERMKTIGNHKNVVRLIYTECLEADNYTIFGIFINMKMRINWIFMEYLNYNFSNKVLRHNYKKMIKKRDLKKMLKDVLNALIKCHDKNIVYGDLKPENIMGRKPLLIIPFINRIDFVLIDFGHSIQLNENEEETSGLEISVGTEYYRSPELQNKDFVKLATASDIWSLGIIVFEIAFLEDIERLGDLIKVFFNSQELINSKINRLKCSYDIKRFLKRCLRINLKDRATAKELLTDPLLT